MSPALDLIEDGRHVSVPCEIDGERVRIPPGAVHEALGWELKPEGLCRGDVCTPVDRDALLSGGDVDLAALAAALRRPLALDAGERAAALGAAADERAQALATLEAPDFTLPDLEGRMHSLSDHLGKKVLLIAYASW
jgi:hypothetical protein